MVSWKGMKPATPDELEFLALVKRQPCCACPPALPCGPTEVHHCLFAGRRISHYHVLPLGTPHHRTGPINVTTHSKRFEAQFGTQRSLWEALMQRLGRTDIQWPQSRIVPRGIA
jgi:hypothetical protein